MDTKDKKNNNPASQQDLSDSFATSSKPNLKTTADAFSTLISAKIKEQELKVGEAEQALQERHLNLLKSVMHIRRSLSDICRIDLGKRFDFELLKDDWQGWPRVRVKLIDKEQKNDELPYLQVTAHDRGGQGTIEIFYLTLQKPYAVSVADANDFSHLPQMLKRAVRGFLDLVTETIIKISSLNNTADEDQRNLAKKNLSNFEEQKINLHEETLFVKDVELEQMLDSLPALDEVSVLTSKQKTKK
ncbi:MAG: hypothetical protein IT292_06155 [Deltaproteobacteria bacterium]|nr:hypothetical protein [Deltaproteobacteria bacterium]